MYFKCRGGGLLASSALIAPIALTSCGIPHDKYLKDLYYGWYTSLTNSDWNRDSNGDVINFHCNSEQQAIALYANFRGWFFNEYLHKQQEPPNQMLKLALSKTGPKELRGVDYKLISQALQRAYAPVDLTVYHGVEYMETEFWDQLKDYITQNQDGSYNYSNCVGKTITSYGFISTSLSKTEAKEYCDGAVFSQDKNWEDIDEFILPLKEKVCFTINIKARTPGCAYLADYPYANTYNYDNQLIIDKDCSFKIVKVWKEGDVNMFELDLI